MCTLKLWPSGDDKGGVPWDFFLKHLLSLGIGHWIQFSKLKINRKNIQPLEHTHGGCNGCIVTMVEPWFCFILQEADEIQFESYSRIEHVITGFWLHAMRGRIYKPKCVPYTIHIGEVKFWKLANNFRLPLCF